MSYVTFPLAAISAIECFIDIEASSVESSLIKSLLQFALLVSAEVGIERTSGRIREISYKVTQPKVLNFDYDRSAPSEMEYEYRVRPIPMYDLHVVLRRLKEAPEWHECANGLTSQFGLSVENSNSYLLQLTQVVFRDTLHNTTPLLDTYFERTIARLMNELRGGEIEHRCRVWLRGLRLSESELKLDDQLTLRRPTPKDYEQERYIGDTSGLPFYLSYSAVIELRVMCRSTGEAEKEINAVLGTLRLLRVSSVVNEQYEIMPQTLSGVGYASKPDNRQQVNYETDFTPNDVPLFLRLYDLLKPMFLSPERIITTADNYLGIAFQRYTEAILEGGGIESRITSAVFALESLYLAPDEKNELSYRLSLRTAALLSSLSSYKALNIKKDLKDAYNTRSAYVHGSGKSLKDRRKPKKDLTPLCSTLLEYARQSIVIFAQLTQLHGEDIKPRIIKLVDDSLLEELSRQRLRDQLAPIFVP